MNVEYTGRQHEVTPAIRKQVESGLAKLAKILGDNFKTNVILTAEKYRHIAEITVTIRGHEMVGVAEGTDMMMAVGNALDNIERQALKYKGRWRTRKRQPKRHFEEMPARASKAMQAAASAAAAPTPVSVVAHSFPASVRHSEPHIVHSSDSVARRPLTLEEAVKEAEFRDRDVFVFRDLEGNVKVLHRKKDGKLELIEA
jgi:putative sigma-54 modulation protein